MAEKYTNLDLDTAEELLVAAGQPEIAKALRLQTQGMRNMMQGEWGLAFMNALDTVLERRLQAYEENNTLLLAGVNNSLQLLNTTVAEVLQIARRALTVAEAGAARLGKLEEDTAVLKQGQDRISQEVSDLRDRHDGQIKDILDRLDRKRHELDDIHAWQEMINEARAKYPEDEIRELIVFVRRKMAEEQAGDGT
jgi:hypothetical protein